MSAQNTRQAALATTEEILHNLSSYVRWIDGLSSSQRTGGTLTTMPIQQTTYGYNRTK